MSHTVARLCVGLVTALAILVSGSLFFTSLRHPGVAIAEKIDFWISLFGLSALLGWLGLGIWLGVASLLFALLLLGLASFMGLVSFWLLFLVLVAFAFISYRIFSQIQLLRSQHGAVIEEWENRSNDLTAEITAHRLQKEALQRKTSRYETLKEFISQLSRDLLLQETIERTIAQSVQMMQGAQKTCLLYLLDRQQQELSLQGSYRTEGESVKHKKGDLLDYWVFKQRQPLIVEDVRKDFRFNIEQQNPEFRREFRSLIAVPLLDEKGILGVLRIDSTNPNQFAPEDLRVLAIIADLATTAIRNAILFATTQELAIKDGLTGLYVHRHFTSRLGEEIQRAFRSEKPLSLVLMDIDWFKKYNDQFGHISGDLVLKQLSRHLVESAQPGEMVARYGGEEFALVLPGCETRVAFARAEKIRQTIEKEIFWLRQEPTRVTISLGVAAFPAQAKDREELIRLADQALYRAKAGGRNQTCSLSVS